MVTIRSLAADLPVGASRSGLICPRCRGGRTGEGSLSLTRDTGGVWYKCHRASCGLAGFKPDLDQSAPAMPVPFVGRPYLFNRALPGPEHWVWDRLAVPVERRGAGLASRLGLFTRADDSNELVWEVRDYDWVTRGHISRTYPGKIVRTWKDREGPWTGYVGLDRVPVIWVVEDLMSASRIALEGGNALALLGTHFSVDAQNELEDYLSRFPHCHTKIVVALDPDAAEVGARLTRDLTFRLGRATIFQPLSADPKDMDPGELKCLVDLHQSR